MEARITLLRKHYKMHAFRGIKVCKIERTEGVGERCPSHG